MKPFIDWNHFYTTATSQLAKPYVWGAKPAKTETEPLAFDCSGFVHWVYGRYGIDVPERSQGQYTVTFPVQNTLQTGDLGFFLNQDGTTKHVGMLIDADTVIEARGHEPTLEAVGTPTKRVLLRPRTRWEDFHEFSGWRRLDVLR